MAARLQFSKLLPQTMSENNDGSTDQYGVLLYYKYTQIPDLNDLLTFYESNCSSLGLLGRVRISSHGVNVTVILNFLYFYFSFDCCPQNSTKLRLKNSSPSRTGLYWFALLFFNLVYICLYKILSIIIIIIFLNWVSLDWWQVILSRETHWSGQGK